MKVKEVLDKTVEFFKTKKIDSPRLDAELLLSYGLGLKNRVDLYLKFDQPLSENELSKCRDLVKRRSLGEPVAYILGEKEFYGIKFLVNANVLIPRPETELLVEHAITWIKKHNLKEPRVLDIGAGSGCIGLSIAKKISDAEVICLEKSQDAAGVAQKNLEALDLGSRVKVIVGDANSLDTQDQLKGQFDVIVANPPYISFEDSNVEKDVRLFEPHSALFAEEMGLKELKAWSMTFQVILKPNALMIFEMGFKQGKEMSEHFNNLNVFQKVEIIKDLSGLDRHILGEKISNSVVQ